MRALYRLMPPRKRLEWYTPFRAMGIRVTYLADDWRVIRIRLPLSRFNRNPGGGMFGGAMASLADPLPALVCARVFPGYAVWTRGMTIDFRHEGRSDLEIRLVMGSPQEQEIRTELSRRQRATPVFEYGFYDTRERLCAWVHNRVAIRPVGYRPGGGALGSPRRG
jgi:acyl-coenzyme A thioesterase PaaI-like protein